MSLGLTLLAPLAWADTPEVVAATATATGDTWRISATVRHTDTGWDHDADAWRVELPDGTILAVRTLLHPHVNEQPFTRSLNGVRIPEGTSAVVVRARDNLHGWGSVTATITLD